MFDIVGIGECVVDMTPAGESEKGNALFERHPGGAPSNMLACAAKQGLKTALISIVGDDSFGHYLVGVLKDVNIDVRAVHFSENLLHWLTTTTAGIDVFLKCSWNLPFRDFLLTI